MVIFQLGGGDKYIWELFNIVLVGGGKYIGSYIIELVVNMTNDRKALSMRS